MKILFTGASSFTGYWFVQALVKAGHQVTITLRKSLANYTGLRRARIEHLLPNCSPIFNSEFGNESFLNLLDSQSYDLLCHHGADVTNYKSPEFDVLAAVASNTRNLPLVLQKLAQGNCKTVLLTGSVFEQNEGQGSEDLRAFSPYGLSKGMTSDCFRYYTDAINMNLGKFVIPNPFGEYEEPRFTSYLIQNWAQGKNAAVNTPDYIRDNIPVTLLAEAYVYFVANLGLKFKKLNPSYYAESQGDFTKRFAHEMRARLGWKCDFTLADQRLFPEPRVRINSDALGSLLPNWSEKQFWDQLASYYEKTPAGFGI